MTVVSISLSPDLLDQLDEFVERSGYSSRSEAIRLAVRDVLSQFSLERLERGRVMATVTVVSEKERRDVNERLMELRHGFDESIFGNMHLHIDGGYCVEIFLVQGDTKDVLGFIYRVRAIRGIREAKYTMTPVNDDDAHTRDLT
jgi:CopG family nickel-responsive transcriptional regulator